MVVATGILRCPKCRTALEARGMQPIRIWPVKVENHTFTGTRRNQGHATVSEVICPNPGCDFKVEDIWDDEQYCRDLAPDFVLDQIDAARLGSRK